MFSAATAIYALEERASTGVRAIGMGEAFIGVADDENSVRRNPAGLVRLDRYAVGFEQAPSKLFGVLETNCLSAVLPASEKIALGIDWTQVGLVDEELDSRRNSFNFAYSYSPFSVLALGANLKYVTWGITLDKQSEGNATGFGTDVGVLLQPNRSWTIGLLVQDFLGFGAGQGLSRDTWMRHDTGVSEKVFSTTYKLGAAFRPKPNWLIAADVTDRLHLGAEFLPYANFAIRAGFQKDLASQEPPSYSLGGRVAYRWLDFNAAYLIPPTLPPTVYVGLSLNIDFRRLPVRIEQVRIRDLYPVHYNYYASPNREVDTIVLDEPITPPVFTDGDRDRHYPLQSLDSIGRIWLKNESNKPVTVRIELYIEQFVGEDGTVVASDIELEPLTRVSVPMRQLVLSRDALALSQAQPVEARIRVIESGGSAYRTDTVTLKLHGNHTTRLDDVAKLGSFISSEDAAIQAFINAIRSVFNLRIESEPVPPNMYTAMVLFNALHGVSYAADPNIPGGSGTIDEIKYPYEMLERLKGQISGDDEVHTFGDCDDSTALYCSLLESAGIQTALIQLPNHVMMAFDLGQVSLDWAEAVDLPDFYYQPINGQVWIPIETTLIKDGFIAAWQTAIQEIRERGVIGSSTVEDAWAKYGASSLRGAKRHFAIPENRIRTRINGDFAHPWLKDFLGYFSKASP